MVFPLSLTLNATEDIKDAVNYPFFRLFTVAQHPSPEQELKTVTGNWSVLTPDNVASFSAVCYLTAREISKLYTSNRTVGLIQSAWGGTRVEAWMSKEALASCTDKPLPGGSVQNQASSLWNGMIAPLVGVTVRAALWYQGEANAEGHNSTSYYSCMFNSMIGDWRRRFGYGDFTFSFVQLPPSVPATEDPSVVSRFQLRQLQIISPQKTGRPEIRAAQALAQPRVEGPSDITAMAVTIDLGGKSSWGWDHPIDKDSISKRLALSTLHAAFGLQEQWNGTLRYTGPIALHATFGSNSIVIQFSSFSANNMRFRNSALCTSCCQTTPFEV